MPQRVVCVQQESVTFVCSSFVFAQIEVCHTHTVGQCEKIRSHICIKAMKQFKPLIFVLFWFFSILLKMFAISTKSSIVKLKLPPAR